MGYMGWVRKNKDLELFLKNEKILGLFYPMNPMHLWLN